MRKPFAVLYLLATIVLFASAGSKPATVRGGGPGVPPTCFPCSDASLAPR